MSAVVMSGMPISILPPRALKPHQFSSRAAAPNSPSTATAGRRRSPILPNPTSRPAVPGGPKPRRPCLTRPPPPSISRAHGLTP
ncbi:hypothetical protein GQ55_5G515000 [Panicum hallii var. hallii]|uniref:Uncharacterized protein n=1 Tax=Panicum hallii var. hallii TaxID=1504633 RepID=A0A2T7DSH0_9POAL|nr:hypothetical protein GQ55_5G515000 [Panicum hallii var. hallii]